GDGLGRRKLHKRQCDVQRAFHPRGDGGERGGAQHAGGNRQHQGGGARHGQQHGGGGRQFLFAAAFHDGGEADIEIGSRHAGGAGQRRLDIITADLEDG